MTVAPHKQEEKRLTPWAIISFDTVLSATATLGFASMRGWGPRVGGGLCHTGYGIVLHCAIENAENASQGLGFFDVPPCLTCLRAGIGQD